MSRRSMAAFLLWVVLALVLCVNAAAEESTLNEQYRCGVWQEDVFDLQCFPARPTCFSVNEEGAMMVGFQEAGRTKLVLFTTDGVQTVYALAINSGLEIVLHTDSVSLYATKDNTELELNLTDASLRRGSQTAGRAMVDARQRADQVSAGNYTLAASTERGVYCLRRNGQLVLQCTWWGTWGKELVVAGYGLILAVIVMMGLLRRGRGYQERLKQKNWQAEGQTPDKPKKRQTL